MSAMGWPMALTVARRELRGGVQGFRIFIACLALGVAAIAGVAALSAAISEGLTRDGRALLGGDVAIRSIQQAATPEQRAFFAANADRVSHFASMRASAIDVQSTARRLVELKGVDDAYPLFGTLALNPPMRPEQALGKVAGRWGAVVETGLLHRLGLAVGDVIRIGKVTFDLRATIDREPDKAIGFFNWGPRVMVTRRAMSETGLMVPGALIRYHYRVGLADTDTPRAFKARLKTAYPEAGWRVRDVSEAAPGLRRFVDQLSLFLTLVGLTALLVGGIGIANAARSHIDTKTNTIAVLKSLGASNSLVFRVYLLQILAMAGIGIGIGLIIGAAVPLIAAPFLSETLPFTLTIAHSPKPFVIAALFGWLTALVFAMLPLSQARSLPAAQIFRGAVGAHRGPVAAKDLMMLAGAGGALCLLIVFSATDWRVAGGFLLGAGGSILLLGGAALGIRMISARLRRNSTARLRLALANLHRPGATTGSVTLSLGLGLTVLVLIAQVESNLTGQINENLPETAPSFFFLDIQPDQSGAFVQLLESYDTIANIRQVPMLRARVTALNGVRAEDVPLPPDDAWFLQGDRGITYAATPPEGTILTAGAWWPEDYTGPPLVSLEDHVAANYGLQLGDTLTVNVLGRDITATIASLRDLEWGSLDLNFTMVFAPALISRAPHTLLTVAQAEAAQEDAIDTAVSHAFENVSTIRVREALETANGILRNIAAALTATAGVTLIAGVLVLAGAVAAGHRRRLYESVVLKTLGARRADVLMVYALEYGGLGLATALIAACIGSFGAWAVLTRVMAADWVFSIQAVLIPLTGGVVVTLTAGFIGTWQALGQKAAPLLRNK